MKKKEHLPIFGVGPLIVSFQIAVTLLGIVLSRFEYFEFGEIAVLNIPLKIVGAGLILFGVNWHPSSSYTLYPLYSFGL